MDEALTPSVLSTCATVGKNVGMDSSTAAEPVLIGANWYRFRAGERIEHPRVMSVCLLWAVDGGGVIRSGRTTLRMERGHLLRLPWGHHVAYRADSRHPFHLGTLHLVPHHLTDGPVVPRVAHEPGDRLLTDPRRRDDPRHPGLHHADARGGAGARLITLGGYAIDRWLGAPFDEQVSRSLARVLMSESDAWVAEQRTQRPSAPLAMMMQFVRDHLDRQWSVQQIADVADVSAATAQRYFTEGTGQSVQEWIRGTRMAEAARLLRTTSLRVSEVAVIVGHPDPLHFSRVFRRVHGVPPSRYGRAELRP